MKQYLSILSGAVLALHQPAAAEAGDRRVSLAYVNDIHAQLEPHPELFWSQGKEDYVLNAGGLSRIATVFKELRTQRPGEMLFIDGGDTIQGSGPAAWTQGRVVVEPMNSLGLDVAIPGNWAVTYGAEAWKSRAAEFNYKMVAANMSDASGKQLFDPYVIKEINGVRVGILGFTEPDVPTRQPPFMSEGLEFQESKVLQPLIDEMKNGTIEI
jgi:2',3'-cyclic-nucleotide 2'-phosphodiesterase (5'-nucleotidase family)